MYTITRTVAGASMTTSFASLTSLAASSNLSATAPATSLKQVMIAVSSNTNNVDTIPIIKLTGNAFSQEITLPGAAMSPKGTSTGASQGLVVHDVDLTTQIGLNLDIQFAGTTADTVDVAVCLVWA